MSDRRRFLLGLGLGGAALAAPSILRAQTAAPPSFRSPRSPTNIRRSLP